MLNLTRIHRGIAHESQFQGPGISGGREGAKSRLTLHPGTARAQIMPSSCRVELVPGDTFEFRAAAGGGFGPPQERDSTALRDDFENGYVSLEGLVRDYAGVRRARLLISSEAAAAVHMHDLAGHVAGGVGNEELRDRGDVLRVADAADERALGDLAPCSSS